MKTLGRLKDIVALGQFGMVLIKAGLQAEIAQALEKTGYSSEILAVGNEFLVKAREMYTENVRKRMSIVISGLLL